MDRKKIEKLLDEVLAVVHDPYEKFEVVKRCDQIRREIYEPDDSLPESVKQSHKKHSKDVSECWVRFRKGPDFFIDNLRLLVHSEN